MSVSVVIPTFNRAELALRTIASVLASADVVALAEIIVVDDQSSDGSRDVLEQHNPDPRVQIMSSAVKGRAGARNTGLRATHGDLVLFLDDDVRVAPNLLGEHLHAHARSEAPTVVQGRIVPDPDSQATVWGEYEDRRFAKIHELASAAPADAPYNCFLTGNVSAPREALQQVGGFDESFAGYGYEDYELGRRLRHQGLKLVYAESAVAYHRTEPLTLSALCRKRYETGRSAALMISKVPEAVSELDMEAPFSVLPYWQRPTRDSLIKAAIKRAFFTRSTAALLGVLCRTTDRPDHPRTLPRLLYCWYGLGFADAARQLTSASESPTR